MCRFCQAGQKVILWKSATGNTGASDGTEMWGRPSRKCSLSWGGSTRSHHHQPHLELTLKNEWASNPPRVSSEKHKNSIPLPFIAHPFQFWSYFSICGSNQSKKSPPSHPVLLQYVAPLCHQILNWLVLVWRHQNWTPTQVKKIHLANLRSPDLALLQSFNRGSDAQGPNRQNCF